MNDMLKKLKYLLRQPTFMKYLYEDNNQIDFIFQSIMFCKVESSI